MEMDTDAVWEKYGKENPYFGVITDEKFKAVNLTEQSKEEFFASGYAYIDDILRNIHQHIDENFRITKALDFGCGTGRLVIPLAAKAQTVTGIDVSTSMLNEARLNCDEKLITNVVLLKSDDQLSALLGSGGYNFIHSVIVFQHIPVARGERIFDQLLRLLDVGGIGVLHFTYAKNYTIQKSLKEKIKTYIPFSQNIINLIKRGSLFPVKLKMEMVMQMNTYNLNRIFECIQQAPVNNCHLEFTDHGGELGVLIYFKKS